MLHDYSVELSMGNRWTLSYVLDYAIVAAISGLAGFIQDRPLKRAHMAALLLEQNGGHSTCAFLTRI